MNKTIFAARINENIYTSEKKREELIDIQNINKGMKSKHITSDTRSYVLVSLK